MKNMIQDEFIKLIKEKGFGYAVSINARKENKNWLCPVCKGKLQITGQKSYMTGCEHVEDPNRENFPERDIYQCIDENCQANKEDVFWNYQGELYGGVGRFDELCIGKNSAPFNSNARKMNVEISYDGVKRSIYLHPILCLWFLRPVINFSYKSNEQGDVLSRSWKFGFLRKDKAKAFRNSGYCISYTPCWETWRYLSSKHKRNAEQYHEQTKEKWKLNYLKNIFTPDIRRTWEYKVHNWYRRTIKYPELYAEYKANGFDLEYREFTKRKRR